MKMIPRLKEVPDRRIPPAKRSVMLVRRDAASMVESL
jgi:hypothetical protein